MYSYPLEEPAIGNQDSLFTAQPLGEIAIAITGIEPILLFCLLYES